MRWRILRRHATTMEEHTAIAGTQAKTAELIGQALQQQGKILNEQTAIMGEQFKFCRKIEAKAERARVFSQIFNLRARVEMLRSVPSRIQPSNYTQKCQTRDEHCPNVFCSITSHHERIKSNVFVTLLT